MTRVRALAAIVVLASATVAVAEDPPGLALAKKIVEENRGDEHREKMRIVWPENVEAAPPEGAEVTLIDGYISYGITRIKWREGAGKLDVCQLFTTRTWFYNKDGESFGARTTTIDAAKFAEAWCAARFVVGARDERLEPPPKDGEPRGSSISIGSHESRKWVRLRVPGDAGPPFVGDRRGSSRDEDGVLEWDDIRDESVFRLFEPFLPPRETPTTAPDPDDVRDVVAEIQRARSRLGEHRLLLEVCLRLAGEFADEYALVAVEGLAATVRSATGADAQSVRDVSEEIEIARTKLRLRHAWDETAAMEFLATNTRERNAQADLDKWVRALWSSKDAEGYAKYLVVAATRTDQVPAALEASLAALKAVDAATAASAARKLLADASPDVRIAAARAILGTTPGDEAAGAALVAIADDRKIADLRTRAWALRSVKEFHVLDAAALKKRLADPRPEHAQIVDWLIDLTKCGSEPVSPEEQIAAWRRVADGPVELGVAKAVDKLVDLEDKASKARVLAALDRLSAALTAKAPGTEDVTMGMIERLREAAEAWPSEAPPK